MGIASRARRATREAIAGRRRAQAIAARLGIGLRDARLATGLTQARASARGGLSQPRWSELERGLGGRASLETWAIAAASLGEQVAAFLERAPGASPPRDLEHLRRQQAVVLASQPGGWTALPELAIDDTPRSRSIDVALLRPGRREVAVVEIWDWLDDVGAAWRGLDAKKRGLIERLGGPSEGSAVGGLFVVRATRRNRRLVGELAGLFGSRFPAQPLQWLEALTDPETRMPRGDGFVWSLPDGRLVAPRLPDRAAGVRE